jgi:hypothetical protein
VPATGRTAQQHNGHLQLAGILEVLALVTCRHPISPVCRVAAAVRCCCCELHLLQASPVDARPGASTADVHR